MKNFHFQHLLLLLLLFLQTHLLISKPTPVFDSISFRNNEMVEEVMVKKSCTGNKGLCLWEKTIRRDTADMEMEMEMDSEINRRMLMMVHKKYISYETLRRDAVPCPNPGASYYSCHAKQANPYNRGCEMISGCRSR